MRALVFFPLAFAACGATDKDGNTEPEPEDLGDPWEQVAYDHVSCQTVDGTPHPGSQIWWVVELERDDTFLDGVITARLFANDSWAPILEADSCDIVWGASGEVVDPFTCTSCEAGADMALVIDKVTTDCPKELYQGLEEGGEAWDIRLTGETESTWYFASSGNRAGDGQWGEQGAWVIYDPRCQWY